MKSAVLIARRKAGKTLGVTLGQGWVFSKPLARPVWNPPAKPAPIRGRRQGATETWS